MTREEAIKFLTLMRKAVSKFEECGHDKASMVIECDKAEAIDMAIEALSAEETIEIKPMEIKGDFRIDDCIYCSPKIVGNVEVVVRCKECRHQKFYINDTESFHCDKSGVVNMHMEDGDGEFFCSYGERREESEVEE